MDSKKTSKTANDGLHLSDTLRKASDAVTALNRSIPKLDLNLTPFSELAKLSKLNFPSLPAIDNLAREWKMPLAVTAFSNHLGLDHLLPTAYLNALPALKFPSLSLPSLDWANLNERYEQTLRFAALNNWFIQPETGISFLSQIEKCKADVATLDLLFSKMTRELASDIESRLLKDHPRHAAQIAELFRLHKEGRYISSIPLTLVVAEGIAHAVSNKSIFNLSKNAPEIASWLKTKDLSSMAKAFLASFDEQFPMSKPRPGKLSRHKVLHGIDPDYGTELFSLQAISLLGFVGWAFACDGLVTDSRAEE